MKKVLSWLFLLIAILFAYVSITMLSTDPGGAGVGFVCTIVAFILFLVLRKGKKQKKTSTPSETATPKASEPIVYATKLGKCYHASSYCDQIRGKMATTLTLSNAKSKGLVPCLKCYPHAFR